MKHKIGLIMAIITVIIAITTVIIYNLKSSKVESKQEMLGNIKKEESINKTYENEVENTIYTSTNAEEKISPNALIIFEKYYKDCKHTIIKRENVESSMVNMTKEKFEKLYSDWKIVKFSNNEIELYKEFEGECGEHYLVKEKDGFISIYKIGSNGDEILLKDTEISTQYLPDIDVKKLKEGVKLTGKEELNSYIENFE